MPDIGSMPAVGCLPNIELMPDPGSMRDVGSLPDIMIRLPGGTESLTLACAGGLAPPARSWGVYKTSSKRREDGACWPSASNLQTPESRVYDYRHSRQRDPDRETERAEPHC